MKILSPLNVALPCGKASGVRWINTVWQLAEAGATVDLLAGMSPSSDVNDIFGFYGLKPHPRLSLRITRPWPIAILNRSSTLRARAYFIELVRLIHVVKPAVLYGTGMPNHLRVLGALKKLMQFRVVLELHEDHSTSAGRQACVRLMGGPHPPLDGIVTASRLHRDLLTKEGAPPHRVHSVYAGNRPDQMPRGERHEMLANLKLPIHHDDFIVLYGGNLYGNRGVEDLLLAFHQVVRQVPKAHLVVLGTGDQETKRRCRALVENKGLDVKVHFTGRVPPTAVGHYLAVADIGVVPNPNRAQWDYTCPIKLSEYLGAGLAVVATNLRTIKEVVGPEEAALLVAPDSPQDMAAAIVRLLTDEELRRTMRERALRVGEKLTYKARAESVCQFLRQLINDG